MNLFNKKIGLGSISLLLFIMGILFSYDFGHNFCIGDIIIDSIGLYSYEPVDGGMHYTTFYSIILFIPAFIVGHKFKNNLGATLGKILSLVAIILILIIAIAYILHKMHLIIL